MYVNFVQSLDLLLTLDTNGFVTVHTGVTKVMVGCACFCGNVPHSLSVFPAVMKMIHARMMMIILVCYVFVLLTVLVDRCIY